MTERSMAYHARLLTASSFTILATEELIGVRNVSYPSRLTVVLDRLASAHRDHAEQHRLVERHRVGKRRGCFCLPTNGRDPVHLMSVAAATDPQQ